MNSYEIKDWKPLCEPANWHEASTMFAMMSTGADGELEGLVSSIKASGLLNPITLLDNKVLDGRNRLLACMSAGVVPRFQDWAGKGSPEEWVIAQNATRRFISSSQKAYAALCLIRKLYGKKEIAGDRRIQIADMVGVGRHYVSDILKIAEWSAQHARPDILTAIKEGESVPSVLRKIDFMNAVASGANPNDHAECPTGQVIYEFLKLIPKHSMRLAYDSAEQWLEGDRRERLRKYWARLDKEYAWTTDKR